MLQNHNITTDPAQIAQGLGVQHHFSSGVYAKQVHLRAGMLAAQHVHKFDHLSILASGRVVLHVEGAAREVRAPAVLTIEAGKRHAVQALEDSTWFCIHATDETDPARVDNVILTRGA